MAFWDDKPDPLNIPFPTLGGRVFWTELERQGGLYDHYGVYESDDRVHESHQVDAQLEILTICCGMNGGKTV